MLDDPSITVLYTGSDGSVPDAIVSSETDAVAHNGSNVEPIEVVVEQTVSDSIDRLNDHDNPIDCIVSEYRLPDGDGIAYLKTVRETQPSLPFLLCVVDGTEAIASEAISAGVTDYVAREAAETLSERIRRAVETHRTEREARLAHDRLAQLSQASGECLWMFDRDWEELQFIAGYEEVWGRPTAAIEANPQDFLDSVHPDDRDFVIEKMGSLSEGNREDIEYRIITDNGETRWVWIKGEPIIEAGTVVRIVGFARDVTERKEREQAYTQAQRQLEAVFNDPNILAGMIDTDGTVLDINETALEYVDTPRTEIVGEPFWETPWFTGDPAVQTSVREWIERAAAGEYVEFEVDLSAAVKTDLIVNGVIRPVFDEDGQVVSLLITDRDVTRRKKQEAELEARVAELERLREFFTEAEQLGNLGAWEFDAEGTVIWTDGTRRIHEVGPEYEPTLQSAIEFYHPHDRDRIEAAVSELLHSEEPMDLEARIITAAGTERWVRVRGKSVPGTDRVRGFTQDITTGKQRKQDLELQAHAMDESPIGIVITDPAQKDNPVVYANEAFKQLTGYGDDAIIGRNCRFLQGPLTTQTTIDQIRAAIDAKEAIETDILNYRQNGTSFWNHLQITPIFGENGDVTHFIGFQNDVTTKIEHQQRTELLNRVLRHNLRNDLNIVLGYLSTFEEDTDATTQPRLTDEERSALTAAQDAATRLLETSKKAGSIESQLDVASFDPRVQSVRELIESAVATVFAGSSVDEGTQIETDGVSDLSVLTPDVIHIAFRELFENASKHVGEDPVEISVSTETDTMRYRPHDGTKSVVRIHVADRNPRLSGLDRDRLLGAEETPVHHGSGLGLWLVHWLVKMSGGVISYRENEPNGNVVTITLPQPIDSPNSADGQPTHSG